MADRRQVLTGAGAASLAFAGPAMGAPGPSSRATRSNAFARKMGSRVRVMVVNDLSGDIDGLFATVHALLSSSAEVRGIVGTAAQQADETAQRSVENAEEILRLMGLSGSIPVYLGAGRKLVDGGAPARSSPKRCATIRDRFT